MPARVKKTRRPSGLNSSPRGVLSSGTRATSFHMVRSRRTSAVAPCCCEATHPVRPSRLSVPLWGWATRSEEHTSELQSHSDLVCRLLLEKKKIKEEYNYNEH